MKEKKKNYFSRVIGVLAKIFTGEYAFLSVSLIILIIVSFDKVFINKFYYFAADVSELYFPWWVFINQKLHSLVIPFRNEFYILGSSPFFARGDPSLFYPLHLLFHIFFDASKNLDVAFYLYFIQQLLHYVVGGIFFYFFVRKGLELDRWASYISSLTYILGGSFMARLVHPPLQYSLAYYPLLFLFYLLFLKKRKLIYVLADAVVIAIIILSGHSQIVYYFLGFFSFAVIYLTLTEKGEDRAKILIISLAMIFWGVLLSAIQLLPAFELTKFSARVSPETTVKNLYNSLHPLYYFTLLVPKLFGRHREGYWGSEYPWGNWDNYLYLGVLPVILLLFSFKWKEKRLLILFYLCTALSFVMTLGKYWGLSAFLNKNMPFSDALSWVNRMTMPFHFFVVALVGIGAQVLSEYKLAWKKNLPIILMISVVEIFLLFMAYNPDFLFGLQPAGKPPPDAKAFTIAQNNVYRTNIIYFFSSLLIMGIFVSKRKLLFFIVSLIFVFDVVSIGQDFNPIEPAYSIPSKMYGVTQEIDYLHKDSNIFRVEGLGPRNVGMVQNIQTVGGYSTVTTKAYQNIIPYVNLDYPSILDLANVKYIISDKNLSSDHFEKVLSPYLWRNKKALPRVFFVNGYKYLYNDEEIIRELTSPVFNPQENILLKSNISLPSISLQEKNVSTPYENVKIISYSPDSINVSVDSKKDGFLFLSELQYPGWYALVDGKRKELINANLSFYALPVEKGPHTVYFKYFSNTFLLGGILSGITWSLTV